MSTFTTKFRTFFLSEELFPIALGARIRRVDYEAYLDLEEAKRQTQAKLDEIVAQARAEGLRQGRQDAQDELLKKVVDMKQTMTDWVQATDAKLVEIVGQCVGEVVKKVDPLCIIEESVYKSLKSIHNEAQLEVRVAPQNAQAVHPMLIQYGATNAKVVADSSLGDADCIVSSPVGKIDMRLDTQLKAITGAIHG